jgi:hypothetical protein
MENNSSSSDAGSIRLQASLKPGAFQKPKNTPKKMQQEVIDLSYEINDGGDHLSKDYEDTLF